MPPFRKRAREADSLEGRLAEAAEGVKESLPDGLYLLIMNAAKAIRDGRDREADLEGKLDAVINALGDVIELKNHYRHKCLKYQRRFGVCRYELVDARRRLQGSGET